MIRTVAFLLALICSAEGYGKASFDSPAHRARMTHSKTSVPRRSASSPFARSEHSGIRYAASRHRHNIQEGGCDRYQIGLDWIQISRAVRPLPPEEKYSEHEILNREEDKRDAALQFAAGCSGTLVAGATIPAGGIGALAVAGGLAGTVAAGKKYESAKNDVKKMRDHNSRYERLGTAQGF